MKKTLSLIFLFFTLSAKAQTTETSWIISTKPDMTATTCAPKKGIFKESFTLDCADQKRKLLAAGCEVSDFSTSNAKEQQIECRFITNCQRKVQTGKGAYSCPEGTEALAGENQICKGSKVGLLENSVACHNYSTSKGSRLNTVGCHHTTQADVNGSTLSCQYESSNCTPSNNSDCPKDYKMSVEYGICVYNPSTFGRRTVPQKTPTLFNNGTPSGSP